MRVLFVSVVLLSGCTEYGFTVGGGFWDQPLPDCLPINGDGLAREATWDGVTDDYCDLNSTDVVPPTGSSNVISFDIKGGTGLNPGSHVVRLQQSDQNMDEAMVSENLTPNATTGTWTAAADATQMGNISACDECIGAFTVGVKDTAKADADECADYLDMEVCFDWEIDNGKRRTSIDSSCVAGSGRFALVPIHGFNKDDDSYTSLAMKPVQISGTGRMTAAAWVSSLNSVVTQGAGMRVLKVGRAYQLGDNDLLMNFEQVSLAVNSQPTVVRARLVSGLPPFVVTEAANSAPFDFKVDMTWTCAAPTALEDVAAPTGYMFDLGDIGCPVSWPQRFVIRPGEDVMDIELYGSVADRIRLPLTPGSGGEAFNYSANGLTVAGRLLSYSPSAGASVALDTVEYANVELCEPDTYTLPAEQ